MFMQKSCLIATLAGFLYLNPCAFAQKWEVGGGIGGSFFTSQQVKSAVLTGDAGLANAVTASAWLGNNSSHLLGGELRYDYENTNLKVASSGVKAAFGAETHAFHYDILVHLTPRSTPIRPYVSAGAGVKLYRGTGREASFQPLSSLALLTKTSEIKPLISVGAGVKFSIFPSLQLRVEIRDALTAFPKTVIAPAQGAKINGWIQDLMVLAGLSFTF